MRAFKICILLFLLSIQFRNVSYSQEFGYDFEYEGIGDNREYFSPYNLAETILGSRFSGLVGFENENRHKVRTGFSYFYEFGSDFL